MKRVVLLAAITALVGCEQPAAPLSEELLELYYSCTARDSSGCKALAQSSLPTPCIEQGRAVTAERRGYYFSHCSLAIMPLDPVVEHKLASLSKPVMLREKDATQACLTSGKGCAKLHEDNPCIRLAERDLPAFNKGSVRANCERNLERATVGRL